MLPLVIAGLVLLTSAKASSSSAGASQAQLLTDLFTDYTPDVRPLCGLDQPIEVKVDLAVRQIIELDEPKQILYLNTWVRLIWTDCSLVWNSSNYSNIENIVVPFNKVWAPDITLYDNGDSELEGSKDYLVSVHSSGTCYYNYPTIITVLCKIDVTYFPFDTQRCPLKLGSWSYHGLELNVTNKNEEGDITSFVPNTEWELQGLPLTRHVIYYGCCVEPYPDVTFYVTFKRKPLFYVLNLLFPCLLITAVALLGFMLPPDAGEKVSLEITVLLSLAVFLLVVSETLPATSDGFPYIGVYFAVAMCLVSFSTLLTVLVLNVHHKGVLNRPVPQWMRKFVLNFLGKIVRLQNERTVHPIDPNSPKPRDDSSDCQQKMYVNGYQEFRNKEHAHNGSNGFGIAANAHNGNNPFHHHHHHNRNNNIMTSELTQRPLGQEFNARPITASSRVTPTVGSRSVSGTTRRGGGDSGLNRSLPTSLDEDSQVGENPNQVLAVLREQLHLMEKEEARMESKIRHDHMSHEWKQVGIVMDRVFFILFLVCMCISTLAILLQLGT